jgi:hypothetical protein
MQVLTGVLAIIINCFGAWHWYIAVRGLTTIEWIDRTPRFSNSALTNLELIFGTRNILKMFLPSVRELSNDGILWPTLDLQYEVEQD